MNARIELPDQYRDAPFRYRDARASGLSAARLRRDDLVHPHRGVRSRAPVLDHEDLCRAFVPRMRPWHAIAGVSAALVWGLPLPSRCSEPQAVIVAVPEDRHPPTGAAVRGLRVRGTLWDRVLVHGIPVLPPLATWATLARVLTADELLVVADALLTSADNYPGLRTDRPHATPDEVVAFAAALRNATGASALRVAAGLARPGVESPMESELRVRLLAAGFPEPEINGRIVAHGTVLARGDLVFREARVVVEYEGDEHRSSVDRFRSDIGRVRRLRAAGWHVVRVTIADLRSPDQAYLRELARELAIVTVRDAPPSA